MGAAIGKGTKLSVESETPGQFTDIVGLDTVSWTGLQLDTVDATNFDSADGGEEAIAGLIKWGELHFEGNWDGTTSQSGLFTDFFAKTKKNFKLQFPSSVATGQDTVTVSGFITQLQVTAPNAEKMRLTGTIKIVAKPTFA